MAQPADPPSAEGGVSKKGNARRKTTAPKKREAPHNTLKMKVSNKNEASKKQLSKHPVVIIKLLIANSATVIKTSQPSLTPQMSTNTPSLRLKHLLGQLSKLDFDWKPQTLENFTLFPKLPLEIRREIWATAANVERQIAIFYADSALGWMDVYFVQLKVSKSEYDGIPSVLHASAESRLEALRFYNKCYDRRSGMNIYINFSSDCLVIDEPRFYTSIRRFDVLEQGIVPSGSQFGEMWNLDTKDLDKIQNVRLVGSLAWRDLARDINSRAIPMMFKILPEMKNLEIITYEDSTIVGPVLSQTTQAREGHLGTEIIRHSHANDMQTEIREHVAKCHSYPANFNAANLKCEFHFKHAHGTGFGVGDPLIVEDDLAPVELVDGVYGNKLMPKTPDRKPPSPSNCHAHRRRSRM